MDKMDDVEIDVKAAIEEAKAIIDSKKMELVDWSRWELEIYPNPGDEKYPELKMLAQAFKNTFNYGDTVTQEDGTGFPEDKIKNLEKIVADIQYGVNVDSTFWDKIREAVLPLYQQPEFSPEDKKKRLDAELSNPRLMRNREQTEANLARFRNERWKEIKMFYDPVGMQVEANLVRGKGTEEETKENLTQTFYPEGFVIKIL